MPPRFRSGSDGIYELSYFGSRVNHTIGESQEVYGTLSGGTLTQHAPDWRNTTDSQRIAYLLEEHENAHHMLLYSSPAGVLLWRLVQVLHRDIAHFSMAKNQLQVEIPQNRKPHDFFRSGDFFEYLIATRGGQLSDFSYPQSIIDAIDKIFLLLDILFDHNPVEKFPDLTVGQLVGLLNDVFKWLAERCDIPTSRPWVTSLPKSEKVFKPGRDWNCMALAEVHAFAKELILLRAFGDICGFRKRVEEFRDDIFGSCFDTVRDFVSLDNEVGFSPHEVQMSALYALSGKIDPSMTASQNLVLEKEFPNFRLARNAETHFDLVRSSARNLSSFSQTPLIGFGSQWLSMHSRANAPNLHSVGDFFTTMLSLGLDRQIYSIKHGLATNAQFVASKMLHQSGQMGDESFNEEWEKWNRELKLSQILCEYSDDFHFSYVDPRAIYPEDHPIWHLEGIELFFTPPLQFISSVLVGFVQQIHLASYRHDQVCKVDVMETKVSNFLRREVPKFSDAIDPAELTKLLIGTLRSYYETEQSPFGPTHIRVNPKRSHLI